jgi:cytochrome c oxidase subunit 1
MASLFTITTLIISVPIAEMVFCYIATLYGGSITLATPMLWALSFVAEFMLGGVTGIFLGAAGADVYLHDTYFVLAHFHYTFFPIAIIGAFAGITFWFPKMFGRMMDERLGKIHFWVTIVAFNVIFIPLFITGAAGDHRRIFDHTGFPDLATPGLQYLRVTATLGLVSLLAVQPVFFFNFIRSMVRGPIASANPWRANTLEWSAPSPPPHGNFAELPVVYRGPYEYSTEDREEDFWPQHLPDDSPAPVASVADLRSA